MELSLPNVSLLISLTINAITLLSMVLRPARRKVKDTVLEITGQEERVALDKHQSEMIARQEQSLNEVKQLIEGVAENVAELEKRIFNNERDRLRGELFNCGNRCRRGIPLTHEEFRYVQGVYKKYTDELHCNSIGTDEYHFIVEYYNSIDNQSRIKL